MQELIEYREIAEEKARAGVVGHNVRYVLAASLSIAVVALAATAMFF
jgi:hypothetical protein